MIKAYTFYDSKVNKLNDFVLAFFDRIEFETGDFSTDFFEKEFYENLVIRHEEILLDSFKKIYKEFKGWGQSKRTELCKAIRESNDIENICNGSVKPTKSLKDPDFIEVFFVDLYNKILFKKIFIENYGDRKAHYHNFRRHANNEYPDCPACGIRPMHTRAEDITEQYDHYLPKDTYPFSAVNFKNLVPVCSDCNSFQVKSNDDILRHTGKVFYPFDTAHQTINFEITIAVQNDSVLENIEWKIDYSCAAGKDNELTAWKAIYKIEDRHQKYLRGNIRSWVDHYWEEVKKSVFIRLVPREFDRKVVYLEGKKDRFLFEYKCLSVFLDSIEMAMSESNAASRYDR